MITHLSIVGIKELIANFTKKRRIKALTRNAPLRYLLFMLVSMNKNDLT